MSKKNESTGAWSTGTQGPATARFASSEATLSHWGVNENKAPYAGRSFMESFSYTADTISLTNGATLVTDREWSAARAGIFVIKGTVDLEPIREALAKEGLFPVQCQLDDNDRAEDAKPKALASIWMNELHDSVCGRYHEIVVSVDAHKTQPDVVAFRPGGAAPPAYACWYNNFGADVCEAQFMHSLYINSPLSIAWGRQMQAFPKHPVPVQSSIDMKGSALMGEVKWGSETILNVSTRKNFGLLGFLKEGVGLLLHLGPGKLLRFLSNAVFQTNIVMPVATAKQNERPQDYTASLWKGLHPAAVKVWPWNPSTDILELGSVTKETGCEDHNGMALLKEANFVPLSVCYMEKLSAVVEIRRMK